MNKFLSKIFLAIFSFSLLLICSSFTGLYLPDYELIVPSVESVLCDGYPKNDLGQTFGPNIGAETADDIYPLPDLLLAENQFGVIGYVKTEDLNRDPETISAAIELTENSVTEEIPMYLHDGVTIVGTFLISPPN